MILTPVSQMRGLQLAEFTQLVEGLGPEHQAPVPEFPTTMLRNKMQVDKEAEVEHLK